MIDFPRDDTDREDGSGLEFEYQLNTPSLARLYQLKALGRTNKIAQRRTLLDKQDLIKMCADDFVESGTIQQEEGGGLEPQTKNVHPMRESMVGQTSRPRRLVRFM